MKKISILFLTIAFFFASFSIDSCKSKTKDNSNDSNVSVDTTVTAPSAPVVISGNDELQKGVTDALKDYPGVKGNVSDSVINLSGEIKRSDWQRLNPTLNSLHPKRVNSADLTIK